MMMMIRSSSSRCQDCGNQAKKDCGFMRCRACCKSRGFQCLTHIKSTWVPLSKRRPTHQHHHHHHQQQQHHLQVPNPKTHPSSSSAAGLGVRNFPAELSIAATFQCVRVSSEDNVVDQYAYQTAVSIGGHIFKGILYDQGPDSNFTAGESSSGGLHQPNIITPSFNTTTTTTCTQYYPPYPKS